jgi:hypothetical protein
MCVVQAKFSSATLNRKSNILIIKFSIIITTEDHAQNTAEDRREQQLTSVLLLKNFLFETRLGLTDNGVGLIAERVKHSQPRGFFFSGGGWFSSRV